MTRRLLQVATWRDTSTRLETTNLSMRRCYHWWRVTWLTTCKTKVIVGHNRMKRTFAAKNSIGESHVQQSYCWTDDSFLTFLHFSFPEASSILILLLPLSVVLIPSSLRLPSAAQVSLITIPSSSLSHSHTEGIVLFPHTRTRARSHCSFIFISIFKFITFSSAVLGGNWALTYNVNLHWSGVVFFSSKEISFNIELDGSPLFRAEDV